VGSRGGSNPLYINPLYGRFKVLYSVASFHDDHLMGKLWGQLSESKLNQFESVRIMDGVELVWASNVAIQLPQAGHCHITVKETIFV